MLVTVPKLIQILNKLYDYTDTCNILVDILQVIIIIIIIINRFV